MSRREVPLDAAQILRTLSERAVAYALIGGLAVQAHGHTRTTQDVDLVPDPDPANLTRLADALHALGARAAGETNAWARDRLSSALGDHAVLSLDTDAGGVDVHADPPGSATFAELRARALVIELGAIEVAVAGRDDLIAMKRASGRPIDRGDVIALTAPERSDKP